MVSAAQKWISTVLSWEEACELNPKLNTGATQVAAE
jgi:hypothetical protein